MNIKKAARNNEGITKYIIVLLHWYKEYTTDLHKSQQKQENFIEPYERKFYWVIDLVIDFLQENFIDF